MHAWMATARPVRMTTLKDFWLADITLRWGKKRGWIDGSREVRKKAGMSPSVLATSCYLLIFHCQTVDLIIICLFVLDLPHESVKTCESIIISSGSDNLCRTMLKRINPPGARVCSNCSAFLTLMHNYYKSPCHFI